MAVHAYTFHGAETHTVTRWHARVTWAVDIEPGRQFTGEITCTHDHLDPDAALKCQRRLAFRIENNPHLFPKVQQAIDAVATLSKTAIPNPEPVNGYRSFMKEEER